MVDDHIDRIKESRKVLYSPEHTAHQYVDTYNQFWAEHYDNDGEKLGFMTWTHGVTAIERYVTGDRSKALILDYAGGTGQCGKRLYEKGYTNLHISDGSHAMLEKAMTLGVYAKSFLGVVERTSGADYLNGVEKLYDAVLSSMSVSEFQPLVEQIVTKALKVGGVFISLEAIPHISLNGLDGINWLIDNAGKDDRYELLVNDDNMPHDKFTDDKMKMLIVRRLK